MEFSYSYSVLLPFYFCKILFSLPLRIHKPPNKKEHIFQLSMTSAIGVIVLMYCNVYYTNSVFDLLLVCKKKNNCPVVFFGMIEGLYCFFLLVINLIMKPIQTVELFNHFIELAKKPNQVSNKFKIKVFFNICMFYIVLLLNFLRNCFFDKDEISIIWIFKIIIQNVHFSVDGVIISFCLMLTASFKEIIYDLNSDDNNIRKNITTFWDQRSLFRKLNACYSPVLVIIVIFKLLQISGFIYFYFISDLKKHWLLLLDVFLPLMNFIWICYCCDGAVSEAQNFIKQLRLLLAEEHCSSAIEEEIQDFLYVTKFVTLNITGCNFFTVDMNLLFKISSVIFSYIVAIVQF